MPPQTPKKARTLQDFAGFLAALNGVGAEYVVIGGCAVSAYARLMGEQSASDDLDLYMRSADLWELLDSKRWRDVRIVKVPEPRSLPVALLEWRSEEIYILTMSSGLPRAEEAIARAREFVLEPEGVTALVADPFHLLANKMSVRREKDVPHIDILRRFVERECVEAFRSEESLRDRIAPAKRLVEVLGRRDLPAGVFEALLPLARMPGDFLFLAHRALDRPSANRVVERARTVGGETLAGEIEAVVSTVRGRDP